MNDELTGRLVEDVAQHSSRRFSLRDDLDNLVKVRPTGAPEATIIYCVRIVESLAENALMLARMDPSPNLFSNLTSLHAYNLIPMSTLYWANSLRWIGNAVRHIRRRVNAVDMELSLAFAEACIEWFFCRCPLALRLASVTKDGARLGLCKSQTFWRMLTEIESSDFDQHVMMELSGNGRNAEFLKTPALPATFAQALIDCEAYEDAAVVLEAGLETYADDLRLRQLQGLLWSRTGELDKALSSLEELYKAAPNDDETTGILAGVHKRVWLRTRDRQDSLKRACRIYTHGWRAGKMRSPYLGINAAATALWQGNLEEARFLAHEVRELLVGRRAVLESAHVQQHLTLNFWDRVTLAEADLLLGNFDEARDAYNAAFEDHRSEQLGGIQVARDQAIEDLHAMGLSATEEEFFSGRQPFTWGKGT